MKTIWKFPLVKTDGQRVFMPQGAEILTVHKQGEMVCLWAIVDPEAPSRPRLIGIYGTGHPMIEGTNKYIGTVQQNEFVWHVFEIL